MEIYNFLFVIDPNIRHCVCVYVEEKITFLRIKFKWNKSNHFMIRVHCNVYDFVKVLICIRLMKWEIKKKIIRKVDFLANVRESCSPSAQWTTDLFSCQINRPIKIEIEKRNGKQFAKSFSYIFFFVRREE